MYTILSDGTSGHGSANALRSAVTEYLHDQGTLIIPCRVNRPSSEQTQDISVARLTVMARCIGSGLRRARNSKTSDTMCTWVAIISKV